MMKKLAALLLSALLTAGAALLPTAADSHVYKTYSEAADGDLLWLVDFNSPEVFDPQPNDTAAQNFIYTIGDGGRSVTINLAPGGSGGRPSYWGGPIKGLEVDRTSQVTMTFKIRANDNRGDNNSTGVGGWLFDSPGESYNTQVVHNYSNWNSIAADGADIQNRAILCIGSSKKANGEAYLYAIDQAVSDEEGFMTCRMEFSGPDSAVWISYLGANGSWVRDEGNTWSLEQLNDTPDSMAFVFYAYPADAGATVKDIKYYRGIGLTDAQLSTEAPAVPSADAAPTDTAPPAADTAPAPDTTAKPAAMPDMAAVYAGAVLCLTAAAAVIIKRMQTA